MQDNARVHTSRLVMDWLDENGYSVITWPPYSPDLNPIEMVWHRVKQRIHKHRPELRRSTAGEQALLDQIEDAVEDAWRAIDSDFLLSLLDSMPRRVQAVIKAQGGYTRY